MTSSSSILGRVAAVLLITAATTTTVGAQGCSVCGADMQVGLPDAIFAFPGQPVVPCGLLEIAGQTGQIPLDQCGFLPGIVMADCGCQPLPPPTSAP